MGKIYTTQTKILQDMSSTLDRIKENDSNMENLKTQGSNMLLTILNGTNDDAITKEDMINCADQIYYSLQELNLLNSKYYLTDSGGEVLKWIQKREYDLLNYVPSIVRDPSDPYTITGPNGEKYNSRTVDLYSCFAPLKTWEYPYNNGNGDYSKRGMYLRYDSNFKYQNSYNMYLNYFTNIAVNRLNSTITSLKNEKSYIDSRIAQLNNEINYLQREIVKLNNRNADLRSENKRLNDRNSYLRSENKRLRSENERLNNENERLRSENERLNNENTKLNNENTKLNTQIPIDEKTLKEKEKALKEEQESARPDQTIINNLKKEIEELNKKIKTSKEKVISNTATINDNTKKINDNTKKINDNIATINANNNTIRNNEAEINSNNNTIRNNEAEINSNNNIINNDNISISNKRSEISSLTARLAALNQEYVEAVSQKNAYRLYSSYDYGYYYDDYFLLQRTIRNLRTEKIRILTGTTTRKGAWGKIYTENSYDDIVKEVSEDERETKQEPCLPSPDDFLNILGQNSYSYNNSLTTAFDSLSYLQQLRNGDVIEKGYLDKFKLRFDSFKNNRKTLKLNLSEKEGSEIYSSLPDYLFYESKGKCAVVRVVSKKIDYIAQELKESYKDPYSKSDDIVKYFVYDYDGYDIYYDELRYSLTVELYVEFINLSDMQEEITPVIKLVDGAYSAVVKYYYNLILDLFKRAKDSYFNAPEGNRCEDFDPSTQYTEANNFISSMPLVSIEQCNSFVNYCLDTLRPWIRNREVALTNTITDVDNAERFVKLALKRLRKNSGTLLIWYQSLINFDDTYINSLISTDIIKDSIKYMLVTTGYDEYNEELFNTKLYPDYIDIEEPSKLYDGRRFYVGDTIYIGRGIKIRQNRIRDIGSVYIDIAGADGNPQRVRVTRLYLYNRLPGWCKTDNPSEVMISKLL